jgi:hypothetical protein
MPLVSVSYIPLSHSSDRFKLWYVLGNGMLKFNLNFRFSRLT